VDHRLRYYRLDRCPSSCQRGFRVIRRHDQFLPVNLAGLLGWKLLLIPEEFPSQLPDHDPPSGTGPKQIRNGVWGLAVLQQLGVRYARLDVADCPS